MQVKICPKCKAENKASSDSCKECHCNLMMVPPTVVSDDNNKATIRRYLVCPVCGKKNYLEDGQKAGDIVFCDECGEDDIRNRTADDIRYEGGIKQKSLAKTIVENKPERPSEHKAIVLKLTNKDDKKDITLEDRHRDYIIGREGDVEAMYLRKYKRISRQHAKIKFDKNKIFIMDNNSMNGTTINETRIDFGEWIELNSNDEICFGDAAFIVEIC